MTHLRAVNSLFGAVLEVPGAIMNAVGLSPAEQQAIGFYTMQPEFMMAQLPELSTLSSYLRGTRAENAAADVYSVAYKTRLAPESYPGLSRAAHFQEANGSLLSAMEGDAQFAKSMENLGVSLERTPTGLTPRQSPAGWTWHHADGLGQMELVPRYQHTPGSSFWPILHPNGYGGYFIWGK